MSVLHETLPPPSAEPQRDRRDDLIDNYKSRGFSEHSIVAQPKRRKLQRVPRTYDMGVYDYGSVELPHETADDELYERVYRTHIESLEKTYGEDNVVVAFATESMIKEEGLANSHQVIMCRTPAWQAEAFARTREELLTPLTMEEARLSLGAVSRAAKALKQIFH